MSAHDYRFVTRWHLDAPPEAVFRIIEDIDAYPRWWPSVWLRVEELRPARADGLGREVRLTTKGRLPYTLCWTSRTTAREFPHRLELGADGDFVGSGRWWFGDHVSGGCTVVYTWEVAAEKALLRVLSPFLRPLFAANHTWAMNRGLESLRLELARRRATTDEERLRIPAPPQPILTGRRRRAQRSPSSSQSMDIRAASATGSSSK